MYARLFSMTHSDQDLKTARDLAAGLGNRSQGAEGYIPMAKAQAFLGIYREAKDPADLAKARENASDSFYLAIYRVTNDSTDLARITSNIGESKPTYLNIWWLMELYKIHRDPQYLAKARYFAKKHGPNNRDYSLPFLEIYKVTKDPQDLASARESRGDVQFLIMIYEISQDPVDLASAREIAAKAPHRVAAIDGYTKIWLRTHQSQDLEAARKLAGNVQEFLIVYRVTKDPQDLAAARKFIGGISDSFSFDKVGGFLEIYRFTKDPQDLELAKKAVAKVKEKSKRAVAAEMVRRAGVPAQTPNKETKEKYASSS
jgi:hypothetical protein